MPKKECSPSVCRDQGKTLVIIGEIAYFVETISVVQIILLN
jgi:hypothetical protein